MNYLEALELIESAEMVRCLSNGYLYRKNDGKVESKNKCDKIWSPSIISISAFVQLEFEEYIEPQISLPFNTPMDAKILVSDDGVEWHNKHFKCFDKDGNVITWSGGCSSFTIGYSYNITETQTWKYAKLPKEEKQYEF